MKLVRKGGLEPPRSCDRQPLKLVRLPIPPLPHLKATKKCSEEPCDLSQRIARYFLAGAGFFGAAGPGEVSRIDPEVCRVAQIASVTEVAMKIAPSTQVIFAIVVTAPRGPKAAWLTPPKAAVISTFSPP